MDIVDRQTRSRMMSGIRGKDTKPEIMVRRFLHRHGFRFRLHVKKLPGTPDIVLPRHRVAILVHGCFWHRHSGCRYATTPATNREKWLAKFEDNVRRDREKQDGLNALGWRVLVLWECGLRTSQPDLDWLPSWIRTSREHFRAWPDAPRLESDT